MRALYLPTTGRHTSSAEEIASHLLQDNVRVDRRSRTYGVVNALVQELERTQSLFSRFDLRPWVADVRVAGSLEGIGDEVERPIPYNDMLYSVPHRWQSRELRSYAYDGSELGDPVRAAEIRTSKGPRLIVETTDKQIVRLGQGLDPERIDPDLEGLLGASAERWTLVSLDEDNYTLFEGRERKEVTITVTIDGLDFVVAGQGVFYIDVEFSAQAQVTSGDSVQDLSYFKEAGFMYDDLGNRVEYTITNDILDFNSPTTTALLHYTGEVQFSYKTSRRVHGGSADVSDRISFADVAPYMYKLPEPSRINARQVTDALCLVPGPSPTGRIIIDAEGFVGDVPVGHSISGALPSEFHTLVLGSGDAGSTLTLVEHDAQKIVLRHRIPDAHVVGATWTADGLLGYVESYEDQLIVHALDDVRRGTSDGFRVPLP